MKEKALREEDLKDITNRFEFAGKSDDLRWVVLQLLRWRSLAIATKGSEGSHA